MAKEQLYQVKFDFIVDCRFDAVEKFGLEQDEFDNMSSPELGDLFLDANIEAGDLVIDEDSIDEPEFASDTEVVASFNASYEVQVSAANEEEALKKGRAAFNNADKGSYEIDQLQAIKESCIQVDKQKDSISIDKD